MSDNVSNFKIPTPEILGPGMWYLIHKRAQRAATEEKKREFVTFIKEVRDDMHCQLCRTHMTEYLLMNPLEPFWNITYLGVEVGLFKWTWNFHNAVNIRLGKPFIDWNTAFNMYYGTIVPVSVCKDCDTNLYPISFKGSSTTNNSKITYTTRTKSSLH